MSRTYRNAWGPELRFRESRTENRNSWVKKIEEEMSGKSEIDTVYIVVNEWVDRSGDEFSETVDGEFFLTEEAARAKLRIIAVEYGILVGDDDFQIEADPSNIDQHLERDTYTIEELKLGRNN